MARALAWATGRVENTIDPLSPNPDTEGMLREEVEIDNHIPFINENGAVYFDYNWACVIDTPLNGFIYVPEMEAIGFKVKIEKIIKLETILNDLDEQSYVPVWRQQCLKGVWPQNCPIPALAGATHKQSRTWIKVIHIKRLSSPIRDPIRLIKWNNRVPLRQFIPPLRRGVYIDDSNL